MTFLAKTAITLAGGAAARRFDAAARDPASSQARKLAEILEANKYTEYGLEHGFGLIESLEQYGREVPVITYEDIRERIDRMAQGERNVLVAELPTMFAQTSGTTGDPKLIPVTPTCRGRDHADQMRTWLYNAQRDHPGMLSGKALSLVSPAVEGYTEAGISYGSCSGQIYRDLPWLVRRTYALPYEVFDIGDYYAKYYAVLRLGMVEPVTFLCTANPSTIVKLCEMMDEESDSLIRDIADGTIRDDVELTAEESRMLEGLLRSDRDRARELEQARSRRDGHLLPADCWPDLALIGCWKGGTVGQHVARFPGWFDPDGDSPVAVRDWGWLSSEARGSVPISDEGCGGVLTVAGNVFEFVPAEDVERWPDDWQRWTILDAASLEEGEEYHVILTTTGGLYRYDINDVVEVVGFHHATPVIEFRRKGRGMTNLTGEKVSADQIVKAVSSAAESLSIEVEHFRAAADADSSRYVFKVEPTESLSDEQARNLLGEIERQLRELNCEYRAKRDSLRLQAPQLEVMQRGWHDHERSGEVAEGKRAFQAKTVVLVEEPQHEVDEEMVEAAVELDKVELDKDT